MTTPRKKTSARKKTTSPRSSSKKKTAAATNSTRRAKSDAAVTLVSVFGPVKARRVLIEMKLSAAQQLFEQLGEQPASPSRLIEAVEHDLADIRTREPELADSQLAATAIALAYELENPYNSATSKSMCARSLNETMDTLRELAPAKRKADRIDKLGDQLEARRTRRPRSPAA